jgi:hypothetical protein
MARSTYCYVVTEYGDPISAFTVKHELVTWLKRQDDVSELKVTRVADGLHGPMPSVMNPEDLIA